MRNQRDVAILQSIHGTLVANIHASRQGTTDVPEPSGPLGHTVNTLSELDGHLDIMSQATRTDLRRIRLEGNLNPESSVEDPQPTDSDT